MENEVLYAVENNVATITMNRPKSLNSMNDGLINGLHDAITKAAADKEVRAIVLTGNGKAFCAGGDLSYLNGIEAAADKKGLAAFYAKNKKKYKWEIKRLKKMKVNLPRNGEYPDVVLADYQDSLEKQWVAQLKKKYKVVVFHSMLTTLNIH